MLYVHSFEVLGPAFENRMEEFGGADVLFRSERISLVW